MVSAKKFEVPWGQVCWQCNTDDFSFECTDELSPLQGFIGQERAIRAIQFGLEVDKPGYNLFVTGLTGTGKGSAIKSHLQTIIDERKAEGERFPIFDWCYVHNFADPDRPQVLRLPSSRGRLLYRGLQELLGTLRGEIPKLFTSEEYTSQRSHIEEEGRADYQKQMQELEKEVQAESFGLQISQAGINLYPLTNKGGPMAPEEFMKLDEQERNTVEEKRGRLLQPVQETMERLKAIEKDTQDNVRALDRRLGEEGLSRLFRNLQEEYRDITEVTEYLAALTEHSLNNLHMFASDEGQPSGSSGQGAQLPRMTQTNPFLPFEINILVSNGDTQAAPIIIESNPTWGNLFGRIERRAFMGTYFSDHTMLKAGAIHQANGGYLVLNVRDLLTNPGVWDGLKRAIRDKETRLE